MRKWPFAVRLPGRSESPSPTASRAKSIDERYRTIPSRRRAVVQPALRGADGPAGAGVAADPARAKRSGRGADGIGEDAGRVPCRDRRPCVARGQGAAAGRDDGRLRLAAEGAVQRHPAQSRRPARRHPPRARGARAARRRHPHARAHRRHAAGGARENAQAPAAHRRHDPRVALRAARLRVGPQDARDDAHRHRRRDPRAGRQQARQPSRAVARAARRADRESAGAHRALRDAEAHRGDRALPGRGIRQVAARRSTAVRDRRRGPRAASRSRARGAVVAARGGDVARGVGAGLRAARRISCASTARRSSSSTRGAWPSVRHAICPSCSAPSR